MADRRQDDTRHALADALQRTRALTLDLVALADDQELRTRFHPDFSPVGWHLGHIATFEAHWVLEQAHGEPPPSPRYELLFDPRQVSKPDRVHLPDREELLAFAADVRTRTLQYLDRAVERTSSRLTQDLYVWWSVLAHEQQHAETIATVLRLRPEARRAEVLGFGAAEDGPCHPAPAPLRFAAERVRLGESDPTLSQDNERPPVEVALAAFELDARPVTNEAWSAFVSSGGYERREWWTEAGWAWRCRSGVKHPSTWQPQGGGYRLSGFAGDGPLPASHPVEGISAHEADAYARSVGARLPTEAEWEHAARSHADRSPRIGVRCGGTRGAATDFIGNVWEWTSSTFAPYPGFEPDPYTGYSQPYFDGTHRVLRGGSWATQDRIARVAFRNWYQPEWRVMFAGLRCARSV